jgi:uncharacterized protein (TIRG00374 family)
MRRRIRSVVSWSLKAGVTVGLLWYVLRSVPVHDVLEALQSTHLSDVAIAVLLLMATRSLNGIRAKQLMDHQGLTLSARQITRMGYISTFYGMVLPGSLSGGLIGWHRLSQQDKQPAAVLAALGFGRLLDTLVVALLGLVGWLLSPAARSRILIGASLVLALAALAALCALALYAHESRWTPRAINRLFRWVPEAVRRKVVQLLERVARYQSLSPRILVSTTALCLSSHLIGVVAFGLFARAVGILLPFMEWMWIRSCSLLISLLPITIKGIGIRETSLLMFLQPFGVGAVEVVALSLVRVASGLCMAALGGLIELKAFFCGPGRAKTGSVKS